LTHTLDGECLEFAIVSRRDSFSVPDNRRSHTNMTERQANELLDIVGAAGYLDVPVTYVRRLVLEKRVTYHKVGKYVRFRPTDLDALVDRRARGSCQVARPLPTNSQTFH
jgi:excisionase family DNA binding protein